MAHVREVAPGAWRVECKRTIEDPDPEEGRVQRRWSLTVHGDKKDADKVAGQAETDIDMGLDPRVRHWEGLRVEPGGGGGATVARWALEWLAAQNYEESWRAKVGRIVAHDIIPAFGSQDVGEVSRIAVQGWLTGLSTKKRPRTGRRLKPATVGHIWGVFSQMMAAAVAEGLRDRDPCIGLKPPKKPRRSAARHALTPAEVVALADELLARTNGGRGLGRRTAYEQLVRRRWRLLTLALAWTGCRWEELGGLRTPEDLHLLARPPYASVTHDGPIKTTGRSSGRYHGDPKSDAGIRDVQMIAQLAGEFAAFVGHGYPYVFGTAHGTPHHYQDYQKAFRAAAARLGHPEWTIHALRHSHATWLRHCPRVAVQERMGWEPQDTADVYTHADDADRAEILRVLAAAWGEGHGAGAASPRALGE